MKTLVRIAAVLAAAAAMALIGLSMGCATVPKVGDGKLEPVTKGAAKAALTAGAVANAEAEAQAAAFDFPAPEVVVPVLDANGERTGTARLLVDHAGQIVVVTDTASPQRTAAVQIAEFKAKRDAAAAKLAKAKAEANGQLQKRIENIESVLGIR